MASPLTLDIQALLERSSPAHRLDQYFKLLMQENQKVNLVSRETSRATFDRIVAESLFPCDHLDLHVGPFLDIGSGGGVPAIPLLLSGRVSGPSVLVERTQKKAAALDRIADELGLSVRVIDRTFEDIRLHDRFELITLSYVKLTARLLEKILAALSPEGTFVYYSTPDFKPAQCRHETISFIVKGDTVVRSFTVFRTN
ncbi:MAG: RsmG family class I SAM-dependent methyltransferase [Candidatus Zixiibacteriota bacterium]